MKNRGNYAVKTDKSAKDYADPHSKGKKNKDENAVAAKIERGIMFVNE
jgi:hypothetical protein